MRNASSEEMFSLWGKEYLVDYTYSFDKITSEYSVTINSVQGIPMELSSIDEFIINALHTEIVTYENQKAKDEAEELYNGKDL